VGFVRSNKAILGYVIVKQGTRGNKMEETGPTAIFIGLTIVSFFIHLFYMVWQSYVLLFDLIIEAIALLIIAAELSTGSLLLLKLSFKKYKT
jgi:transmembrane protein 216